MTLTLDLKISSLLRHKAIIFMKAGPHSGNALHDIIKMKVEEQDKFGKFYWGYSGSLCYPYRVQEFAQKITNSGSLPLLVLSPTKSAYNVEGIKKVYEYSVDNKTWNKLPFGVYLWNCKFAVTATDLKKVDLYIDLNEYVVATDNKKRSLGDYIKYRVNKACAIFSGPSFLQPRLVKVSYIANLVAPFCVFLR